MSKDTSSISPKFCGSCGKELLKGATFCAYCGAPVPTIHTSQATSAKPSSEPIISPTTVSTGHPPYPYQYTPTQRITEPPFPFIQHFQGVLLSPQNEMPQIVKRPNLRQPLWIVFFAGALAGIAMYIVMSRVLPRIEFTSEFFASFGVSPEMLQGFGMDEFMRMTLTLTALLSPLEFIISWIFSSLILWIVLTIIGSQIPSYERNFKTSATIVGWSFLPRIFEETINIIYNFIFVPIPSSTVTISNMTEFSAITTATSSEIISLAFLVVGLLFLIWSAIIIYFAIKSFNLEGSRAVIVVIIYMLVSYFLPYLLTIPFF
ncbi:MAG: YIP1 family protein [Candidatus Hermodarchaeota archaeon]